jgi:hypothetical protein
MTKNQLKKTWKEVYKLVKENIRQGESKQSIFERLFVQYKLPSEQLAKLIQSIPSNKMREKYKKLNYALAILLLITIITKLSLGFTMINEYDISLAILFVLPCFNVLFLIGVLTFTQDVHRLLGTFSIFSLPHFLAIISAKQVSSFVYFDLFILLAVIGVSFYLNVKLCPSFSVVKERFQNRVRNVIIFQD